MSNQLALIDGSAYLDQYLGEKSEAMCRLSKKVLGQLGNVYNAILAPNHHPNLVKSRE